MTRAEPGAGATDNPEAQPKRTRGRKPGSKNKPKTNGGAHTLSVRLDVCMDKLQIVEVLKSHAVDQLEAMGMDAGTFEEMELQVNANGTWQPVTSPIRFASKDSR